MSNVKCAAISVALLSLFANVAAGRDREVLLKLSGREFSGGFAAFDGFTGKQIEASFNSVAMPDGSGALLVYWAVCIVPPALPYEPTCTEQMIGLAPKSAVRVHGNGTVEVHVDPREMLAVYLSSGASVLSGTFTRSTGAFSSSTRTSGVNTYQTSFPGWPDPGKLITLVQKVNGNHLTFNATFAGMVGREVVQPTGPYANASMSIHDGGTVAFLFTE